MEPVTAVMVGAGERGHFTYGRFAERHPNRLRFVAVADPNAEHRERFGEVHGIPGPRRYSSWDGLFAKGQMADTCFIATPDRDHHLSAPAALETGYDVLLEKPIAASLTDTVRLVSHAGQSRRLLHVGHVLRYTPFFSTLHRIVTSGRLGDIATVEHRENVVHWHMAHSFVRGNWAKAAESTPMIVQKCCHDFDILQWNLGDPVRRLSSSGSLIHFRPENAPEGATKRCTDGCPAGPECAFDARRLYLDMDRTGWPVHVISTDLSPGGRRRALETGPYGRCVYTAGSDVVDHQVVGMELASGASVVLVMHGHSHEEGRTMRYDGTRATLRGVFGRKSSIEITDHVTGKREEIPIPRAVSGHGGGDEGVVDSFLAAIRGGERSLTTAQESLESHFLAFAAEEARVSGAIIDMDEFRRLAEG